MDITPQLNQNQPPSFEKILSDLDQNNDRKISENESIGPLKNSFTQIDTNQDGFIDQKEFEKGPRPNNQHNQSPIYKIEDTPYFGKTVNVSYFISENIIGKIDTIQKEIGTIKVDCIQFSTHSQATEHEMGPWCPTHIDDDHEHGGIWFKDGKVYDVSGHFIAELDEFYSDDRWKLYRDDGSIKVTNTLEGCLAAAKPNVEETHQNFCVECLPDYFKDQITTYVIPLNPVYLTTTQPFSHGALGVAFNGVNYDPPAPTHAILAAHTIAPLDVSGGHVNPHGGYHYHAVTGATKEIEQPDDHAPQIGYAIDGFGIFALKDKFGNIPNDLDECGGHFDEIRGYHYHAGEPGANQIIKCLHGIPGTSSVKE